MRILYDSKNSKYKSPFGAIKTEEKFNINIKIPLSCKTEEVYILFENDNTKESFKFPLKFICSNEDYATYGNEISLNVKGLYFYYFNIKTIQSQFNLFRFGYNETNIEAGDKWQLTCYPKDFKVPESFLGKVMYQIFPDRFFRESIENAEGKLEPYYIHENTDDVPDFKPNENGKILNWDFFGGNLKGIIKKLDYIKSLGTSIIYLNPIFMAYSNHRYDTCDYKKIDPLLGTDEDFINLCNEAHKKNIKIILDGVFSHTGSNSVYFDKNYIFKNGAYSNDNSPYKYWYSFGKSKDDYISWWGIDTLPCVNELSESFLKFIIEDDDSVISHWLNLGADGFRLDVADELPDEFIKRLRNKVKQIKPDSLIIGEVWEDASNKISYGIRRKYFTDSELDSVMNYCFKNSIISYCMDNITSKEFAQQIMTICENYPKDSIHSLMNSLSTHDTARILTVLGVSGDGKTKEEKAGFKMSPKIRNIAKSKLYIAVLLQYTLPGTASIYYGDEIGMEGFGDPFNRGYFKWNDMDESIYDFFIQLGKIKNSNIALQKGDIEFLKYDDVLIFDRIYNDEKIEILINKGNEEIPISKKEIILFQNASIKNNKIYVQKNGFIMYKK